VYYDLKNDAFVDPLQGIPAIREKRMTTVAPAEKVFGEDGLRLMRLARQAAQTGFYPDCECLDGAKRNATLILDIVPERLFTELSLLLHADLKYGVSEGQYAGVSLLNETRVLDHILPELTLGRGMSQRADFHDYDILEHSLRAVRYAAPSVRLAALLHDIGKPVCTLRDGNAFAHPETGAEIAKTVLARWKAPHKTADRIARLVALHMYDYNSQTKENKLRRFFVRHYDILQDLLFLKQADFSACKDDLAPAPTVTRWQALLDKMQEERAPFSLRDLDISGKDLLDLGIPPREISTRLSALLDFAVLHPQYNRKERLLRLANKLPCTR
jgi:tRNA nucleotidyltransferase (CCA-adding enzyme)